MTNYCAVPDFLNDDIIIMEVIAKEISPVHYACNAESSLIRPSKYLVFYILSPGDITWCATYMLLYTKNPDID